MRSNKKGSREEKIEKSDDLAQPIDLQAAAGFNRFSAKLAETVANNAARPQWKPDSFFRRFQADR